MKKITLLFLSMAICATKSVLALSGSGIEADPYLIATASDLLSINSMYSVDNPASIELKYFELSDDIDMTGQTWTPLNMANKYNKHIHLDGKGHVIKNLTCTANANYSAFIGVLCGTIKNLGVVNATISGQATCGIIAGYLGNSSSDNAYAGIIENCFSTGTVKSTSGNRVGGIVGNVGVNGGKNLIKNCYSTADVTSYTITCGGIAGNLSTVNGSIIQNCYSIGTIRSLSIGQSSTGYVGSIVGYIQGGASQINGCVARNDTLIIDHATSGMIGRIAFANSSATTTVFDNLASAATIDQSSKTTFVTSFSETAFTSGGRYDGVTTSEANLSLQSTYTSIGWDFANVWSPTFHNKYPIFQWLKNRADYKQISGFPSSTDATLADLKFKGATVTDFVPATGTYSMALPYGADLPAIEDITFTKNHFGATVSISKSAETFPVTLTVTVTAEDETTKKSYTVDFTESSLTGLNNLDATGLKVYSHAGDIQVTVSGELNVKVYNVSGNLLFNNTVNGATTVHLPAGIYFVKAGSDVVKVIVK